jgi:hypothetical protein
MKEMITISLKQIVVISSIWMLCSVPSAKSHAQQSRDESRLGVKHPSLLREMKSDSTATGTADSTGSLAQVGFLRNTGFGVPGTYISMRKDLFFGYERYQVTRFDRMLEGAQLGAKVGLFMSAIGTTSGMWDEDNSWYLVGAMSALGALLLGMPQDDEPQWRVRLQWKPDRSPRGVREFE